MNNLTLSEIIRRNTNLTQVPRHVFYSTQHCIDVKNETCVPEKRPIDPQEQVESLKQRVSELRNKCDNLESTLAQKNNENKDLTNQVIFLKQKYNSTLNNTCEQTTENDQKMELEFRIIVLVLIGVLFTSTIVFFVLYLRAKKACKKLHSQFAENGFSKRLRKPQYFSNELFNSL